jgi:putative ABC transport system substrate-binding protein
VKLRRQLLLAIGACAIGKPVRVLAQQRAKVWRVGFLTAQRRPESLQAGIFGAFLNAMRELGYVEGKNLSVEWRFADGRYARFPGLAAELVQLE